GHDNYLRGVSAASATDVWAAGTYSTPAIAEPLFEHWDGKAWTVVRPAGVARAANKLVDVSAASGDDVWAVGTSFLLVGGDRPLTEHWDGVKWTELNAPRLGGEGSFSAVDAISSTDVWGVGYGQFAPSGMLIEFSRGTC